jgi:ABC-type uncharacterized transport system substrate-binding protein
MPIRCAFLFALLAALGFTRPALAHPHAWISVRTTVFVNEKGEATALREHWLFDKMYSAYAIEDFNPNKNGKFDAKDLIPLAKENLSNLKEYGYFTVFENGDGKAVGFKELKDIASVFEKVPALSKKKEIIYATPKGQPANPPPSDSKQISMDFTLTLNAPVDLRAKGAVYRIYDPTYYVDMTHVDHNAVKFVSEKDGKELSSCHAKVELPKIDTAMLFNAAALDKNAKGPADLGYYFSEKVTLSCSQPK